MSDWTNKTNKYCVSGKKKSQENKNKANKTEDIQLKTSEPDSTSANMRDSVEGKLGFWTRMIRVYIATSYFDFVSPWNALWESSSNHKGLNSRKVAWI